jgi:predicted DNA-binding transcriptional regulator AlpA
MSTLSPSTVVNEQTSRGQDWSSLRQHQIQLDEDRLLRAAEVQRELGVSRATAYRMMTDGTLPTCRFGGRNGRRAMVRVSQKDLRAWIAAHRVISASVAHRF